MAGLKLGPVIIGAGTDEDKLHDLVPFEQGQ